MIRRAWKWNMAEWNRRTLKHIDYEEDKVKQWRGNAATGLWCLSGGTWSNPTLTQIGEKYGKTAAQVALHWLLQSDVIIIPKTVHKERMQENLNICIKIIRMENYGRKIIDYILVNGQTSLQYLMNVSKKYRQIATEAIFECLRLGYPLNDMEISGKARELLRKRNVIG